MTSEELTISPICKFCGHAFRSHKEIGKSKKSGCTYCECKGFTPS